MNAQVPATIERASVQVGAAPQALVPTSLSGVWKLAEIIAHSGMAPKDMKTAEQIAVAVLHGLEIGMTPMAALQSIAVVNGRPTIWGDGALGLVRASGLLESIEETVAGSGDGRAATCKVKRKGDKIVVERTFSWADAKKAGLSSKAGPWQQYPDRMMSMRARAFAIRDAFPDVLRGLSIREEQEDVVRDNGAPALEPPAAPTASLTPPSPPKQETVENVPYTEVAADTPAATAGDSKDAAPLSEESPAPSSEPEHEPFDGDEFLATLAEDLAAAQTLEDTAETKALFAQELDLLTRSQREKAEYLFEQAEDRIKGAAKPAGAETPAEPEDDLEPPSPAVPADPFAVPSAFKDVEDYRQWILVMIQSASTKAHAGIMRTAWKTTQIARSELGMSMSTVNELKGLALAKVKELEAA